MNSDAAITKYAQEHSDPVPPDGKVAPGNRQSETQSPLAVSHLVPIAPRSDTGTCHYTPCAAEILHLRAGLLVAHCGFGEASSPEPAEVDFVPFISADSLVGGSGSGDADSAPNLRALKYRL